MKDGEKIGIISETDKKQFENYNWVKPNIIKFPTLDKLDTLAGVLNGEMDKKVKNRDRKEYLEPRERKTGLEQRK